MPQVKRLSDDIHQRLLGWVPTPPTAKDKADIDVVMNQFQLTEVEDKSTVVNLPLPRFLGTVQETLKAATDMFGKEPLSRLDQLEWQLRSSCLPTRPKWQPGWQFQEFGSMVWVRASEPTSETAMVLDFETVKVGDEWFPTCCAVLADSGWYIWCADLWSLQRTVEFTNSQVIVGHNVGYDRSFLASEYPQQDSGNRFFDTMAAWIATRGFTNQQRAAFVEAQKDDEYTPRWVDETATNGLDSVYEFYQNKVLDKGVRDSIKTHGLVWMQQQGAEDVLWYCIKDVLATYKVFRHVYPEWKQAQPSDVSKTAQILLGNTWLPLSTERWYDYYNKAEAKYQETMEYISQSLRKVADDILDKYCPLARISNEEIAEIVKPELGEKYTKKALNDAIRKYVHDVALAKPVVTDVQLASLDWTLASTGENRGVPMWYRKTDAKLTLKTRITPMLLGCLWRGEPILWNETEERYYTEAHGNLPHPEKHHKKLSQLFVQKIEGAVELGTLTAAGGLTELLAAMCSTINWTSMRERVLAQKVENLEGFPVVLPRIVVTGTITRRCADNTWQVASNPKAKRIGTELKSMIEAPAGYRIVGADVDSQELWIAACLGDMYLGFVGSSPLGLLVTVGNKKDGTDPHSVLANNQDLSRDLAKNIIYGMCYGLSLRGCIDYIAKSKPGTLLEAVTMAATSVVQYFKGDKVNWKWVNGLASRSFNKMEDIANSRVPETPVLGAKLTMALRNTREFTTTRINWVIQSSGVDFRDIFICLLRYLFVKLGIDGRLLMSIHDEFRAMVAEAHVKRAVYAFQLAHVMTRALFIDILGLDCIPAGVAWHESVDVDTVLRKSPYADQVTPSQTEAIPPGYEVSAKDMLSWW